MEAGLKVILKKTAEYAIPEEFQYVIDENPALKTAFASLTSERHRACLFYFSQPKQSKTKTLRVKKCI